MNRVQSQRSATPLARPSGRASGELYANIPDRQLGVVDFTAQPVDLIAVRYFSAETNYAIGDFVVEAGQLWRAIVPVTPAPFNPAQWEAAGGGGATIGDTAPASPNAGDLWFDSVGGQMYVWYDDGSSQQWVIVVNNHPDLSDYAVWAGGDFTGPISGTSADFSGNMNVGVPPRTVQFITNPGVGASVNINALSGETRNVAGLSNGLERWNLVLGDNTPESGTGLGSNFLIEAIWNDGVFTYTAMSINRDSGVTDFYRPPTVAGVPIALLSELDELRDRLKVLEDQIARPKGAR